MIILTDTREQLPYTFKNWSVQVQTSGLKTGDYSLSGFEDKIAIERKSLNDLISCLKGENRKRFEKELCRARAYELFAVVVEADIAQVMAKQYYGSMNPHAILQSITAFYIRYNIPFLFCGDRQSGEYITYSLLQKYIYNIQKRFEEYKKGG